MLPKYMQDYIFEEEECRDFGEFSLLNMTSFSNNEMHVAVPNETVAVKHSFKKDKKRLQDVNKHELKSCNKRAEKNIERLSALSLNTGKAKDAEKIDQQAHKERYVKMVPKNMQDYIFEEEECRDFGEFSLLNMTSFSNNEMHVAVPNETVAVKHSFKKDKKRLQDVNKHELKSCNKRAEKNIGRLSALSLNTVKAKDAEKIDQQAHKERYVKMVPKNMQDYIFEEEECRDFGEFSLLNMTSFSNNEMHVAVPKKTVAVEHSFKKDKKRLKQKMQKN